MFFAITIEDENKWNEYTQNPEEKNNLPVTKITANKGLVYVYYMNEQPFYLCNSEEAKKATEEYYELVKDIPQIIKSFKFNKKGTLSQKF